jgi:hypothetical protein
LINLWDMLKAYAYAFSNLQVQLLIRALEEVKAGGIEHEWELISDKMRARIEQLLHETEQCCKELNLQSSCDQIEWIRRNKNWNHNLMERSLDDLRRRIEGELKQRQFLYVPLNRSAYYDQPELFGAPVRKRFPSAVDDIIEAGNCFALGRWSGAVHQCLGVMQSGLIALARHLKRGINIHVDTWEDIIRRVEEGVAAKRQAMTKARWKKVESFYAEVVSDLRAVKEAWRNPDAHFRRPFDEAGAQKVLEKVRDFMQNLATRVHEK